MNRLRRASSLGVVPLCIVLGMSAVACSDGSDDGPLATTVPPGAADVAPSTDDVAPPTSDGMTAAADAAPAAPTGDVSIELSASDLGLDVELLADASVDADPFGDYVACAGTRAEVGAYAVTVARTSGDPLAVSLLSGERVTGPGVVDVDVRIERPVGDPIVAAGTMTLDPGLRSGTFVAFAPDGGVRIEGAFDCDAPTAPQPLAERAGASVEVVALLRQGDAERIASLATSDPTLASCPGDVAGQPLVLRADGGPELGSLTTFELTMDGDDAALRMRLGEHVEVFDDVTVVLDDDRSSGTFAGTAGELSVDGAFTCT